MWYELLLKELFISKLKKTEHIEAIQFLDIFFQKYLNVAGKVIPPLALLGLIYKLHKKYDLLENETLTLQQLSREFVGLSIILMKASFDEAIWSVDFKLDNPVIKSALGLTSSNISFKTGNNAGKFNVTPDEWEGPKFPDDINQIQSFLGQIKYLEVVAFRALNYDLSIDFEYILPIFIKNRSHIFPALFDYLNEGFIGESDIFDEFVYKMKLIIIVYQYIEQENLQGIQALLNAAPDKVAEITLEWELTLGSSKYITPSIISKSIRHLNNIENRTAFLTESLSNNQSDIANFLRANTVCSEEELIKSQLPTPATTIRESTKTPLVLRFTQITQLIKNCNELLKNRTFRVEQSPAWQNELWQLLKEINAQLTDEEKTQTQWQKITLKELSKLCESHHIKIISELEGSVFEASQLNDHNSVTPLQSSLLQGFCTSQSGFFSQAKIHIEPPTSLQESLLQGFH